MPKSETHYLIHNQKSHLFKVPLKPHFSPENKAKNGSKYVREKEN